jgi:hypothetical protein
MFQLTIEEAEMVVPQNAAPSPRSRLGGHLPFVFTQEGIAMLSGVLRSPRAVRANAATLWTRLSSPAEVGFEPKQPLWAV